MNKQFAAHINKRAKDERAKARREGRILMIEVIATLPKGMLVTPQSNILDPNRKLYNRRRDKRDWHKEEY